MKYITQTESLNIPLNKFEGAINVIHNYSLIDIQELQSAITCLLNSGTTHLLCEAAYPELDKLMLLGFNIKEATEDQIAEHMQEVRDTTRKKLVKQIAQYKHTLSELEADLQNFTD